MSALLKFRFRWRADGKDQTTVVEATNYPLACYRLGRDHAMTLMQKTGPPPDFELDLTKPERVE